MLDSVMAHTLLLLDIVRLIDEPPSALCPSLLETPLMILLNNEHFAPMSLIDAMNGAHSWKP